MDVSRPAFRPDPSLDRQAMEELQREIARTATFEDRFGFAPAAVGRQPNQRKLGTDGSTSAGTPGSGPLVAGIDQAFLDGRAVSAVVVSHGGEVVERAHAVTDLEIPYIPGLLAFREGGPVLDALAALDHEPDLLVVDGSGRIHFRQAGLATHIGVTVDTPSIGVAKSLLCGRPREPVDGRPVGWKTAIEADDSVEPVGDSTRGTVLGYAYQSRQYEQRPRINPLYISPGHRVNASTAVDLVADLCDGYKLPEPTRLADAHASELRDGLTDE